jgi:hypothetical protein
MNKIAIKGHPSGSSEVLEVVAKVEKQWRTSRKAIATLFLLRFTAKRNTNRSI